jgi:hypothetical protein
MARIQLALTAAALSVALLARHNGVATIGQRHEVD